MCSWQRSPEKRAVKMTAQITFSYQCHFKIVNLFCKGLFCTPFFVGNCPTDQFFIRDIKLCSIARTMKSTISKWGRQKAKASVVSIESTKFAQQNLWSTFQLFKVLRSSVLFIFDILLESGKGAKIVKFCCSQHDIWTQICTPLYIWYQRWLS